MVGSSHPIVTIVPEPSDAELVSRCCGPDRALGQAAFDLVVQRHGPTVWAMCRGILGNGPDADDAFQATFITLMQCGARIREPSSLSSWLCGVAARVARRTLQRRTRHHTREVTTTVNGPLSLNSLDCGRDVDPLSRSVTQEAVAIVWAELGELPDQYRHPIVMCHLEGHTVQAAAQLLRCPLGTLKSRLSKGRELLRSRLVRRGVTLSLATVLAWLGESRASSAPSPELVRATTTAACNGCTSPTINQLTEDTMRELTRTSGRTIVAIAVTLLVAVGTATWTAFGDGPPTKSDTAAPQQRALAKDDRANIVGTLLVVSQRESTLSMLDPATGKVRAVVNTGTCPHEVAVSPNGKLAAVSNYGLPFGAKFGSTVTLVDVTTGKVTKTIEVGEGNAPHGLCWLSDERLLCTVEKAEAIVEIDAARATTVRKLRSAHPGTHMVVASAKLQRAYTTNVLSDTASAFDLAKSEKLKDIRVGKAPEGVALSPDGKHLWVGNRADNTISVVATEDGAILKTLPSAGMPFRLQFTPNGESVLVAETASGELTVFDAKTMRETKRIDLNAGPILFDTPGPISGAASMTVSSDGKFAYCSMFLSKAIAVVDLSAGKVVAKYDVAREPDGIAFSTVVTPTVSLVQKPKPNLDAFQGEWQVLSITQSGKEAPKEAVEEMTLVVKGDERIVRKGEDTVSKATFSIDSTKQPPTIDVTVSDGPLAGKTLVGIYEIKGDSLKICLAMSGDKRPDDFTAKEESGRLLQTYTKLPAKKAAP